MAIRLYWWQEKRLDGRENFGDLLSRYLVEKISNKKVISIKHPKSGLQNRFFKNYLVIGSIITAASNKSIIWGSGIIKKNENIRKAKFVAVRGPKTRERILELGYECPKIYGDPAILLPKYFNKNVSKKHKIGIIPHYVDYDEVSEVVEDENIKIINILTNNVEKTIVEILECEFIISSSLHGVIVSQAYNIPALWVKFSNKLSGDNIKFYDYFQSMNININKEIAINPKDINFNVLLSLFNNNNNILPDNKIFEQCQNDLLNTCPFVK